MPFRLNDQRAKVQFITSAQMPSLVYRACKATGIPSNTRYYQVAVCEKLSRDLGIPLQDLLDRLPPARGMAAAIFGPDRRVQRRPGHPVEEVR